MVMKATELNIMQKAVIVHVDLKEKDAMRLFYLGIYVGAQIQLIRRAPLGDPLIFHVQGSDLILRTQDACRLEVEV